MITIENANAPKKYSFDFELHNGYSLVKDYDYEDEYDNWDCGAIYVVDEKNEVVSTIDPAWAKDAKGNNVYTYYEVKGNTLVQHVDFDANSVFPIVADPTSHPNKTYYFYLTREGVKKERDKYTGLSYANMASGVLGLASIICAAKGGVIAAVAAPTIPALSTILVVGSEYNSSKYSTWNKILDNFPTDKSYARVAATYKWHSGQRSYYPTGRLTATYVNKEW